MNFQGMTAFLPRLVPAVNEFSRDDGVFPTARARRSRFASSVPLEYAYAAMNRPLEDGKLYTLDPCPNEWYAYWCAQVVNGLCDGEPNKLYDRLQKAPPPGDGAGSPGQTAFLAGLDAFHQAGLFHDFEASKREY